jgi:uncharacterized protein
MKLFNTTIIIIAITLLLVPACDDSATPTPVTLVLEHTGEPYSETFMDGLSGRTSLEGGMLFDFKDTVTTGFQMRGTLIPLSIAFVSEESIIVDIVDMEPLSNEIYTSSEPYRYAIEVNQGYFEETKIAVSDRIEFQEETQSGFVTITFPR